MAEHTVSEHAADTSVYMWAPLDQPHLLIHLHFSCSDSGEVECCLSFLNDKNQVHHTNRGKETTVQNNSNKSPQAYIYRVYIGNLFQFTFFFFSSSSTHLNDHHHRFCFLFFF